MPYFTELDFNILRCSVPYWDITVLRLATLCFAIVNYTKLDFASF